MAEAAALFGPDSWCAACGEAVGPGARVVTSTRGEAAYAAVLHAGCDEPTDAYAGRGQHRLVCSALPDGRPALVANVDVDVVAVDAAGVPAIAAPLESAGWARWPAAPDVVDGWVEPGRAVVTVLGEWPLAADPAWWGLVEERGELVVLVLADRHVDAWARAAGFAEVAAWIDDAVLLAARVRVRG
ncbi:hypothetical protein [Mariniluteicoccus flavus]